ncbi:MAG: DMT family transporter [Ruminococcaceae bacterium]|nr:DMT family transporter [Oscillospiraceae bacterium]
MKNKGVFYSLLVMMLWGFLFPTVKKGYAVFGAETVGDFLAFAGVRFLICGIIICLYAFIKDKNSFKALKGNMLLVMLVGLFAIILHYSCTYIALSLTDGSKTAILKQLGAVFYICFAALFFKDDKFTLKKGLGLILGVGGIFAINAGGGSFTFQIGDLLIIGASFCTVFANISGKKVFERVEPIVVTGVSQVFGGIVLLIIGAFFGGNPTMFLPTKVDQALVFGGIIFASIFSYCIWYTVVKKENLSKLFIIKFSEPLFAAIFGWIIIGEDIFKIKYLIAFILISLGVYVANIKEKSKGV